MTDHAQERWAERFPHLDPLQDLNIRTPLKPEHEKENLMNLNDFFNQEAHIRKDLSVGDRSIARFFERIMCQDGFSLSVQANQFVYCLPRSSYGPYTHVEVGFPSETPESLLDYAETPEDPTETVYYRVPIELVETLIEQHGGMPS